MVEKAYASASTYAEGTNIVIYCLHFVLLMTRRSVQEANKDAFQFDHPLRPPQRLVPKSAVVLGVCGYS